jgi:ABC-type sugar transport system substrate-binding protein
MESTSMRYVRKTTILALGALMLGSFGAASSAAAPSRSAAGPLTAAQLAAPLTAAQKAQLKGKSICHMEYNSSGNPWSAAQNKTMGNYWQNDGIKVTLLEDPLDPALQAQHFSQCIALHPSLIQVNVADTHAIIPSLLRAKAAKITVIGTNVILDKKALGLVVTQGVTANNHQLGQYAGENLVAGLKKAGYTKANIMIIAGTLSLGITQDRLAAFKKVLSQYPQYKIVSIQDSNWDPTVSGQMASSTLAAWKSKGGIQGAYGEADYMAIPIANSAQQLGLKVGAKPGGIVVVGSNCTGAGVRAVTSGTLAGDADQSPVSQGVMQAQIAEHVLLGDNVAKSYFQDEHKITPQNVKGFYGECTY